MSLPPLPEPFVDDYYFLTPQGEQEVSLWDAERVRAYGQQCADTERERCADICKGIAATHTGEARRLKAQFGTLAAGMRDGANECAAAIRSANT